MHNLRLQNTDEDFMYICIYKCKPFFLWGSVIVMATACATPATIFLRDSFTRVVMFTLIWLLVFLRLLT